MRKIRWAVAGLGNFAEGAILPAFAKAKNSELCALVSGDEAKSRRLGHRFGARFSVHYEDYAAFLARGNVDAVYIVLPNHLHHDYTIKAAQSGVHVLCEKPLAVNVAEGQDMIAACSRARVKLMTAYRLHLDPATRAATAAARSGKLGELRFFDSHFSFEIEKGNVRLAPRQQGGGPLHDVGVYCINASRHLFDAEPIEVTALGASASGDARFTKVEEQVGVTMRFPGGRLATFTVSFGAALGNRYSLYGTKGALHFDNAYFFRGSRLHDTRIGARATRKTYPQIDQLAAQVRYFADCILKDTPPAPSGQEGVADLRVIEAIGQALDSGARTKV